MTRTAASAALRELLQRADLSANAAAAKAGVAQSTLSRILSGDIASPRGEVVERLGKLFGVRADVVLGLTPIPSGSGSVITDYRLLPLTTIDDALTTMQRDKAKEWLPCPVECSAGSFALQIDSSSCEPDLLIGDYLMLDPEAKPRNGCFALIRHPEHDRVIRRLAIEGAMIYAKAGPHWPEPALQIAPEDILAVAVFRGAKI